MENTHKRLEALNADSIRTLVNSINDLGIRKEDVLDIIPRGDDSYFLLYYEDLD